MSSKHSNPYDEGRHYGKLFAFLRGKQVVTRDEMVAEAVRLGISNEITKGSTAGISPAMAMVTVLLSPRHPDAVRAGADCRGNASAAGHVYYMEKLEGRKYRLRWRDKPMEPKSRGVTKPAPKATVKAKASTKSPAKKTAKSPAKKTAPAKVEAPAPEAPAPAVDAAPATV